MVSGFAAAPRGTAISRQIENATHGMTNLTPRHRSPGGQPRAIRQTERLTGEQFTGTNVYTGRKTTFCQPHTLISDRGHCRERATSRHRESPPRAMAATSSFTGEEKV